MIESNHRHIHHLSRRMQPAFRSVVRHSKPPHDPDTPAMLQSSDQHTAPECLHEFAPTIHHVPSCVCVSGRTECYEHVDPVRWRAGPYRRHPGPLPNGRQGQYLASWHRRLRNPHGFVVLSLCPNARSSSTDSCATRPGQIQWRVGVTCSSTKTPSIRT